MTSMKMPKTCLEVRWVTVAVINIKWLTHVTPPKACFHILYVIYAPGGRLHSSACPIQPRTVGCRPVHCRWTEVPLIELFLCIQMFLFADSSLAKETLGVTDAFTLNSGINLTRNSLNDYSQTKSDTEEKRCWGLKCVHLFVSSRHTVGDTKVPFCLQSCVKPLKYAIAVHDHGTEYVHRFIGKEPSGLRFNKLFLNEDGQKKTPVTSITHSQPGSGWHSQHDRASSWSGCHGDVFNYWWESLTAG